MHAFFFLYLLYFIYLFIDLLYFLYVFIYCTLFICLSTYCTFFMYLFTVLFWTDILVRIVLFSYGLASFVQPLVNVLLFKKSIYHFSFLAFCFFFFTFQVVFLLLVSIFFPFTFFFISFFSKIQLSLYYSTVIFLLPCSFFYLFLKV